MPAWATARESGSRPPFDKIPNWFHTQAMKPTRPVDLTFFESAPLLIHTSIDLPATPEAVFAALAEPATWLEWFPLMTRAEWTTTDTQAVGAERAVSIRLFGHFNERFVAWDVPNGDAARFAFMMTATSSPLANAIAEDYRLTRTATGTRLDWTFASDMTPLGRVMRPVLVIIMKRLFSRAGRNLARHLQKEA